MQMIGEICNRSPEEKVNLMNIPEPTGTSFAVIDLIVQECFLSIDRSAMGGFSL